MVSELMLSLTGMPSPGKARLAQALEAAGLSLSKSAPDLRVHAETDLEALLEPGLLTGTHADAAAADLVIAVDWESTAHSVGRVIELVAARGVEPRHQEAV